jgi:hypothetical protein
VASSNLLRGYKRLLLIVGYLQIILIFFPPLIGFTVCLCSTLTFLVSRQDLVHIRKCKLRRKRHLKQNHKFKSFNLSIMVEEHHCVYYRSS